MSVFDIFSKRQKRLRGEVPDVYSYDNLPDPLKVQIIQIWEAALGTAQAYADMQRGPLRAYSFIVGTLRHEYGVFSLVGPQAPEVGNAVSELFAFFLGERTADKALDAVELCFRVIDTATRESRYRQLDDASARADAAIEELNARFREHGVGYQFVEGKIVRLDSELLHVEVVKPALSLLRAPEYAGAQEEFLKAHEHYRHQRMKEALAECLKALESVMKAICAKRNWSHDPNATSKTLIDVLFAKGLIPFFWSGHFSALRSTLESGVPTARNKLGGHGQGAQVVEVPDYLVAYVLHQTASAIVFLAEADKALP